MKGVQKKKDPKEGPESGNESLESPHSSPSSISEKRSILTVDSFARVLHPSNSCAGYLQSRGLILSTCYNISFG